jgi:hypothetical protein
MTFDAQCDLAAVVYGADDDPDRLFINFTNDLSRSGLRTGRLDPGGLHLPIGGTAAGCHGVV